MGVQLRELGDEERAARRGDPRDHGERRARSSTSADEQARTRSRRGAGASRRGRAARRASSRRTFERCSGTASLGRRGPRSRRCAWSSARGRRARRADARAGAELRERGPTARAARRAARRRAGRRRRREADGSPARAAARVSGARAGVELSLLAAELREVRGTTERARRVGARCGPRRRSRSPSVALAGAASSSRRSRGSSARARATAPACARSSPTAAPRSCRASSAPSPTCSRSRPGWSGGREPCSASACSGWWSSASSTRAPPWRICARAPARRRSCRSRRCRLHGRRPLTRTDTARGRAGPAAAA